MLPIVIYVISALIPFLLIPLRLQDLLPVSFLLPNPLSHRYALSSSRPTCAIRDLVTIPVAADIITPSVSSSAIQHVAAIYPQEERPIDTSKIYAFVTNILWIWKVDLEIPVLPVLIAILFGFGAWKLWTMSTVENIDRPFVTVYFQHPNEALSEDLSVADDDEECSEKAECGTSPSSDGDMPMDFTPPFCSSRYRSIHSAMDGSPAVDTTATAYDDGEYTKTMELSPVHPARCIPSPRQSFHSEVDGSPADYGFDPSITHLFSLTTIPKTISVDDFFTLCELEKQGVDLRGGMGLLKYRIIQNRLRSYALQMKLEKIKAARAERNKRQNLSPIPRL